MKQSDNGSSDSDHVSNLPRWIGISGAILLILLLKACASFAGPGDFDARNRIQTHGTGPTAPAPIPTLVELHHVSFSSVATGLRCCFSAADFGASLEWRPDSPLRWETDFQSVQHGYLNVQNFSPKQRTLSALITS